MTTAERMVRRRRMVAARASVREYVDWIASEMKMQCDQDKDAKGDLAEMERRTASDISQKG